MPNYHFEVRLDGETLYQARDVFLHNTMEAWVIVGELANSFDQDGTQIFVRDFTDHLIILIGNRTGRAMTEFAQQMAQLQLSVSAMWLSPNFWFKSFS